MYKDDAGVLCRRWNWREADRTKLEKTTTRAILVCEDLFSGSNELAQKPCEEALSFEENFLHARGVTVVLSAMNTEFAH